MLYILLFVAFFIALLLLLCAEDSLISATYHIYNLVCKYPYLDPAAIRNTYSTFL